MSKFDWRVLFRSEKQKIRHISAAEIEPAPLPEGKIATDQEENISNLGLVLMARVAEAAVVSGRIRTEVTRQVALQAQGRT